MIGKYPWEVVNAKAMDLIAEFGEEARHVVYRIRAAARRKELNELNEFFYEVDARLAQEISVSFKEERRLRSVEQRIDQELSAPLEKLLRKRV